MFRVHNLIFLYLVNATFYEKFMTAMKDMLNVNLCRKFEYLLGRPC